MANEPTVVLVGGWSWHRHVGDDAILHAHLAELSRWLPRHRATVVCGEPELFASRMPVESIWSAAPAIVQLLSRRGIEPSTCTSADLVPVVAEVTAVASAGRASDLDHLAPLVAAIAASDAVIAASAGSLAGAYPLAVAEQVVAITIAQALGKYVVVSGASLGPFDGADAELLGPALARADLVCVRDATISARRARDLGVAEQRLRVQPDPAHWMKPGDGAKAEAVLLSAGLERDARFGVLTVAPWTDGEDQADALAAVADAVADVTGMPFLGIPMFLPPGVGDADVLDAIGERLDDPRRLVRVDPLPEDPVLLALCGRARVVVGSRFHGAVLAARGGAPAVLVHDGAYQRDKAESLAKTTSSVRAVPLGAGATTIASVALEQMQTAPRAIAPVGPLPAIAWLAEHLRVSTLSAVSISSDSSRPPAWLDPPETSGDEVRLRLRIGDETRVAIYTCRDGSLQGNPDAGFAAALPMAMGLASSLDVPAGVSRRLLDASEGIQRLLAAWDPRLLPVDVRAGGGAPTSPPEVEARGTAVFFTGGVDSFYTVLTRREEIDALVHVYGFDLPLGEEHKHALVSASLRGVARELGLPLIEIVTDLRAASDPTCDWERIYTSAALASVGHLLASRFGRILIPATHSFRDLHPIGTHPLLDPLYSSERVRFEHVDSVTRVEKLAYLAESELAMSSLRVCFQPEVETLNCGRCPKCMRTMAGLRAVGALGRCSTLPAELPLREMSSGKVRGRRSLTYVWENLEAVEARGDDPDLALALTRLVARGTRDDAWAQARRLAVAARRSAGARLPLVRRALRAARRIWRPRRRR